MIQKSAQKVPLGQHVGPGELCVLTNESRETYFCEGINSWWVHTGFHLTQMNCMVLGTYMDVLLLPQTCLNQIFFASPHKNEINAQAPWSLPVAFPISLGGQCLYCPVWGRTMASFGPSGPNMKIYGLGPKCMQKCGCFMGAAFY